MQLHYTVPGLVELPNGDRIRADRIFAIKLGNSSDALPWHVRVEYDSRGDGYERGNNAIVIPASSIEHRGQLAAAIATTLAKVLAANASPEGKD